MSRPPHQRSLDGERLRRAGAADRRELERKISERLPHGAVILFADGATLPDGWHRCNGQTLLRSRYPRLAAALFGTGDDAQFEVPAIVAPAGLDYWIWGPEGTD